jgi:hypothetical protein
VQKEFDHGIGDSAPGRSFAISVSALPRGPDVVGSSRPPGHCPGSVTAALLGLNERTFRRRRQNLRIRRHFDFGVGVQSPGDHCSCEPSELADGVPDIQYENDSPDKETQNTQKEVEHRGSRHSSPRSPGRNRRRRGRSSVSTTAPGAAADATETPPCRAGMAADPFRYNVLERARAIVDARTIVFDARAIVFEGCAATRPGIAILPRRATVGSRL